MALSQRLKSSSREVAYAVTALPLDLNPCFSTRSLIKRHSRAQIRTRIGRPRLLALWRRPSRGAQTLGLLCRLQSRVHKGRSKAGGRGRRRGGTLLGALPLPCELLLQRDLRRRLLLGRLLLGRLLCSCLRLLLGGLGLAHLHHAWHDGLWLALAPFGEGWAEHWRHADEPPRVDRVEEEGKRSKGQQHCEERPRLGHLSADLGLYGRVRLLDPLASERVD